jgi:hypothetical protein
MIKTTEMKPPGDSAQIRNLSRVLHTLQYFSIFESETRLDVLGLKTILSRSFELRYKGPSASLIVAPRRRRSGRTYRGGGLSCAFSRLLLPAPTVLRTIYRKVFAGARCPSHPRHPLPRTTSPILHLLIMSCGLESRYYLVVATLFDIFPHTLFDIFPHESLPPPPGRPLPLRIGIERACR